MKKKRENLQVYVSKDTRDKAEDIAKKNGFENVQDLIRYFLRQVADGRSVPKIEIETAEKVLKTESVELESLGIFAKKASDKDVEIVYTPVRIMDVDGDGDKELVID